MTLVTILAIFFAIMLPVALIARSDSMRGLARLTAVETVLVTDGSPQRQELVNGRRERAALPALSPSRGAEIRTRDLLTPSQAR